MQEIQIDLSKAEVLATREHKVVYRCGSCAVKVFDDSFSKADILNEALNQARVEEVYKDIPKVLEVGKYDGRWAIVSEYISGPTLADLMDRDPEKETEYLERFVNLQNKILNVKPPMLNKLIDKMQGKVSKTELQATVRYELHMRLNAIAHQDKLCHGDFCPSNVICCENGHDYVIDWSHVTRGNAEADAARTYLVFVLSGKKELAEKYVKMYCDLTDTARQQIQKWLPIVAASQSVKKRPEERELLFKWANITDFS